MLTLGGPFWVMEAHFPRRSRSSNSVDRQATSSLLVRTGWDTRQALITHSLSKVTDKIPIAKQTLLLQLQILCQVRPVQFSATSSGLFLPTARVLNVFMLTEHSNASRPRRRRVSPVAPIVCETEDCGQTFTMKKDRDRHQREIHGSLRWFCIFPGCKYKLASDGASRRSNVERHIQTMHGNMPVEPYIVQR
jgi:hypothetical protein